jgi:hypothetical protein
MTYWNIQSKRCSVLLISAAIAGCGFIAVQTAEPKRASTTRTEAAVKADQLFWETFRRGDYANIGATTEVLKQAYQADPSDAVTAAHIAWMHKWRLGERARLDRVPAMITDDAMLARRYFQEAVNLNPHEARYQGFLASSMLVEGRIHKDEKLTRRGYFTLLDSIDAWPEFNLFTAGYVTSNEPRGSKNFNQAMEWQWENLAACVGEKLDRADPNYAKYMALETKEGKKRACWNSWIAPHNLEGFFLNMGDMLVKSGDWQTAQKIYANAKIPPSYGQWKFRDVLERRIANAQSNVEIFNSAQPGADKINQRTMFNSPFNCMACHQSN